MKKQSIIITIFSTLLAGTLIFLGIFLTFKPDKEKEGSIKQNQTLEEEFERSKKEIL